MKYNYITLTDTLGGGETSFVSKNNFFGETSFVSQILLAIAGHCQWLGVGTAIMASIDRGKIERVFYY